MTRIDVLERCQQILHNTELSWDDSDMATAFTRILRRVIDSYGRYEHFIIVDLRYSG